MICAKNSRVSISQQFNGQLLYINYYINLDQVFQVPVLSAQFFTETGQTLSHTELSSLIPIAQDLGKISEREHEVIHEPVFFIHPCRTKEFLKPFIENGNDYLHVWLVRYGPVFFYKLPF